MSLIRRRQLCLPFLSLTSFLRSTEWEQMAERILMSPYHHHPSFLPLSFQYFLSTPIENNIFLFTILITISFTAHARTRIGRLKKTGEKRIRSGNPIVCIWPHTDITHVILIKNDWGNVICYVQDTSRDFDLHVCIFCMYYTYFCACETVPHLSQIA